MSKAFIKGRLQRVVRRIGNRILGEDAAKDGDPVTRTASASQRIALRGRVTTQPDKCYVVGKSSPSRDHRIILGIRQMEIHRKRGSSRNDEGTVRKIGAARTVAENGIQIQASLRISIVQIVGGEQPMTLRTHVAHLQLQVSAQLTLERQVILRRIL